MSFNWTQIDKIVAKKSKLAVWLVSNCIYTKGAAIRKKYVESLVRGGLRIDLGGKCYSKSKNWKLEDYKFYFAFENSISCKDYVTEKFFNNALRYNTVPVVFGTLKSDYDKIAPPNSYIYARDYSNKELIKLLHYLDRNDTAYKEYFKWKLIPYERVQQRHRQYGECQLCRMLHGINYDTMFDENSKNLNTSQIFTNTLAPKQLPSISKWLFDGDNKACLDNSFTFTSRLLYALKEYHCISASAILFLLLLLTYFAPNMIQFNSKRF